MSRHNRLAAVARTLDPMPPEPIMMVLSGLLPDQELAKLPLRTRLGGLRLEQQAEEADEEFRKRAMEEARKAGEAYVRVSRIPEDWNNY